MPPLKAFNRTWPLAGDDLLLPALLGGAVHSAWLALLAGLWASRGSCTPYALTTTYAAMNAALVGTSLVAEVRVGLLSLKGSVRDATPRRNLKFWVPALVILNSCDVLTQALGIYLLVGGGDAWHLECPASRTPVILIHLSVGIGIITQIIWFGALAQVFLLSSPVNFSTLQQKDSWDRWLRFLCFGHSSSLSTRASALVRSGNGRGLGTHGDDSLLRDVARVFGDIFQDAEFVVSDIFIGLIYVRHLQRKARRNIMLEAQRNGEPTYSAIISGTPSPAELDIYTSTTQQPSSFVMSFSQPPAVIPQTSIPMSTLSPKLNPQPQSTSIPNASPLDSSSDTPLQSHALHSRVALDDEMREIIHFSQYAEAIYGLPLHMITNFSNFTRTLHHLCIPECCTGDSEYHGPPQSVVENVRNHLGRPGWPFCCVQERAPRHRHHDLITISLENGLFRSPYMVCLDHERSKIVVAVRGTMSTADVLVDLNCTLAELTIPMHPPTSSDPNPPLLHTKTHAGMLQTARHIHQDISGLLESLTTSPTTQSYETIVCGHSLGAAVGALLTHLLRTQNKISARCIAYSPPGCIATPKANQLHFRHFVTSIVLGDDAVPRLTRRSVERLKRKVGEGVRRCSARKVDVVGGFLGAECFGVKVSGAGGDDFDEMFGLNGAEGGGGEVVIDVREDGEEEGDDGREELQVPGRVIHFRKEKVLVAPNGGGGEEDEDEDEDVGTDNGSSAALAVNAASLGVTGRSAKLKKVYRAVWSEPGQFRDIIISSTMVSEHMPHILGQILRKAGDTEGQYVNDVNFR
ncbi:alpha/beta-hydrolase [Rhizoclosmatium globosum]|uniref:sn-1-specific diacylglycerol lipase n=1 Tax=Rhizoclosmatium globosum TaxID=329046 RepID=A0A1Y2C9Q8_9FUNG|nr:alpha/beta-hydrolase [Rhizoclosmatium globosum]|eukprot:ORY43055.1 alpha/beta-hydrolase [Rhizoclosmatium globosum]